MLKCVCFRITYSLIGPSKYLHETLLIVLPRLGCQVAEHQIGVVERERLVNKSLSVVVDAGEPSNLIENS